MLVVHSEMFGMLLATNVDRENYEMNYLRENFGKSMHRNTLVAVMTHN